MLYCTAYIDEAGDEGFGKLRSPGRSGQSHWLAIGACLVRHDSDLLLPRWRDEILHALAKESRRDLHFRDLNHEQRVVACRSLSSKKLGAAVILSNKSMLLNHEKVHIFKRKGYLYNYMIRYLLERVTQACADAAARDNQDKVSLKIVFSRRGGTDYQSMKDYLFLIKQGRDYT